MRWAGLIEGQKAGGPVFPGRKGLRRQAEQQAGQRPEPPGEPQRVLWTVAFVSRQRGLVAPGFEEYPLRGGFGRAQE